MLKINTTLKSALFTINQQIWTNWENIDALLTNMQIIIDRPVAVTTILDNQGQDLHLHNQCL